MGRAPCCDKANVKKGPWSPEEDDTLKSYIQKNGTGGNWIALPQKIGLKRCGKSCRLRWLNYLRPNIKHGGFSDEEDDIICSLYVSIGPRWSIIAARLPGRTDNDIKNYWNTRLKKKLIGKQRKELQESRIKQELNKYEFDQNPIFSGFGGAINNQTLISWPELPLMVLPQQTQNPNYHQEDQKPFKLHQKELQNQNPFNDFSQVVYGNHNTINSTTSSTDSPLQIVHQYNLLGHEQMSTDQSLLQEIDKFQMELINGGGVVNYGTSRNSNTTDQMVDGGLTESYYGMGNLVNNGSSVGLSTTSGADQNSNISWEYDSSLSYHPQINNIDISHEFDIDFEHKLLQDPQAFEDSRFFG